MAHHKKRHGPAPVPSGNLPREGTSAGAQVDQQAEAGGGAPMQEQDAKRRLGGFESAGEHSRVQPSAINDGQHHSR